MFNATARATQQRIVLRPVGLLTDWASSLASLFETTSIAEREALAHRLFLFVIAAIGCSVRFWTLGAIGLHGDEETMAMATMGVVREGAPILPSGMFYPRGLTEIALMALSVSLFGESEFAFRLPSALAGVALIFVAWFVGRRFLRPTWNLAFAAVIALLPEIVEYSQTARMYVFLLLSIAACMACVFKWEETDRPVWLGAGVFALIVGVELHTLAVTSVLLFLFPGVLRGDLRKLALGAIAAVVSLGAFVAVDVWVTSNYPVPPPEYAADLGAPPWDRARASPEFGLTFDIMLWLVGITVAGFAVHVARRVPNRIAAVVVSAALLCALLAQLILFYHVAAILFVAGVIVARRYGGPMVWRRLSIFALGAGLLALLHGALIASTPGSLIKFVGVFVGQPSVWPYVRILEFTWIGGALALGALVFGLWRLAIGRAAPDYALLGLLAVWIPMFMIGLFSWNVPPRYTAASLLPMLLTAFAFAQHAVDIQVREGVLKRFAGAGAAVLAALAAVLVVNPLAAARSINAGYAVHPDHKGAAEFIRSQGVKDEDVLLAEDVLQQTYYLGKVDYWLISREQSRQFVTRIDGEFRDFYTGTPIVHNAQMLDELLRKHADKRIYVIGSGENMHEQRRVMRGDMGPLLRSDRFEVVYTGRDKVTYVWRARSAPKPVETAPDKTSRAELAPTAARAR